MELWKEHGYWIQRQEKHMRSVNCFCWLWMQLVMKFKWIRENCNQGDGNIQHSVTIVHHQDGPPFSWFFFGRKMKKKTLFLYFGSGERGDSLVYYQTIVFNCTFRGPPKKIIADHLCSMDHQLKNTDLDLGRVCVCALNSSTTISIRIYGFVYACINVSLYTNTSK